VSRHREIGEIREKINSPELPDLPVGTLNSTEALE
jgi:hypothetical protein